MRIGINARMLGKPFLEGIGKYTHEIVKHLSKNYPNDEFVLYVDNYRVDLSAYENNVISSNLMLSPRHPILWHLWFEYLLPWGSKRDEIDVFFSPEGMIGAGMKMPTVMTTHDLVFERYPSYVKRSHSNYLRKKSIRYHEAVDHVIAVSNFTKKEIIDLYDLDPDKITVAHNGCSEDFYPLDLDDMENFKQEENINYKYLLYVGSLHPRKNIIRLVDAFEQFKKNDHQEYKLVLAGRLAWLSDKIKTKINDSAYTDDIVHLDYFYGDINGLINGATTLIYPSLYEGFGLPVVEAMSAGTPVITSEESAMSEVGSVAARYVNPENVSSLVNAISQIVNDGQLQMRMSNDGMERSKDFDWNRTAELTYECFTRVLNQ